MERDNIYLHKAQESLAGAQSEFVNGRYNNAANRAYYACFQAAVQALRDAGIEPHTTPGQWKHDALQATFAIELIRRRKAYSSQLAPVLLRNHELRGIADYERHAMTETQAARAVGRAEAFVGAVEQGGDRQ